MSSANSFIVKIKRGETPFYSFLGKIARKILFPTALHVPAFLKSPLRILYELHFACYVATSQASLSEFFLQSSVVSSTLRNRWRGCRD